MSAILALKQQNGVMSMVTSKKFLKIGLNSIWRRNCTVKYVLETRSSLSQDILRN